MQLRKLSIFIVLMFFCHLFLACPAYSGVAATRLYAVASASELYGAQESLTLLPNSYFVNLDKVTVERGYIVRSLDNNFRLNITPEAVNQETGVEVKKISLNPPLPKGETGGFILVSDVFEFDLKNKQAYNKEKPLVLELKQIRESNKLKRIYYWDDSKSEWIALPSESNPKDDLVRAPIHLPYAKVAILEDVRLMESGMASWYRYKDCNCAASPDYPKGTFLKVINLENNKSVIVKINDYGPDRQIHPDRVIDLDKAAFNKIAGLKKGVVWVKVESL